MLTCDDTYIGCLEVGVDNSGIAALTTNNGNIAHPSWRHAAISTREGTRGIHAVDKQQPLITCQSQQAAREQQYPFQSATQHMFLAVVQPDSR